MDGTVTKVVRSKTEPEATQVDLRTQVLAGAGTLRYESRLRKMASALKKYVVFQRERFLGKTGASRERSPSDPDWTYLRGASILVKCLYHRRSVAELKRVYGGKKRRGVKPSVFADASGAYVRRIVQTLQEAKLLEMSKAPLKGRYLSYKGVNFVKKYMLER